MPLTTTAAKSAILGLGLPVVPPLTDAQAQSILDAIGYVDLVNLFTEADAVIRNVSTPAAQVSHLALYNAVLNAGPLSTP